LSSTAAVAIRPQTRQRHWPFAARTGLSVLLLAWIFTRFHWDAVPASLGARAPQWLLAAWVLFGIPIFLISVRWHLLLQAQGIRVALRRVVAITCIGQFFNTFLLGSTGGDAMRVVYILREAPETKARAGLSLLVDRAVGLLVLAMLALAAASTEWNWLMSRGDLRHVVWILEAIAAFSVAGVVAVAVTPLPRLCSRWGLPPKAAAGLTTIYSAAHAYLGAPLAMGKAAALTIAVQLTNMAGGYCVARALGLPIGFASMGVILAIVFFVISVPITASGHGLRESIFVLMFSLFGVNSSTALVYSMCYLGLTLGWSLACAPVYLAFRASKPAYGL
jgi:glycosyltransferase 2 family protein